MANLLDLDEIDFTQSEQKPSESDEKFKMTEAEKLEKLFGPDTGDEFDIFGTSNDKPRTESKSSAQSMDDFFDSFMKSEPASATTKSHDLSHDLDVLLPTGASPSSTDLLDLDPFGTLPSATNTGTKPQTDTGTSGDLLDDFFGSPPVTSTNTDKGLEQTDRDTMADGSLGQETKKTNLRKGGLENSFEDLLKDLSDDSDLDLDEMISDDHEYSTNLESLLESPEKTKQPPGVSGDVMTPGKHLDSLDIMEAVTSTPKVDDSAGVPEVRVVTPEGSLKSEEEEEEEEDGDDGNWEMVKKDELEEMEADEDLNNCDVSADVVLRVKETQGEDRRNSQADSTDDDIDLSAVTGGDHLDVDINKQKSSLGKKGSLATRRKQTRQGRKSLLSGGEDAIFKDSTEPRSPSHVANGDDVFDDGYSDNSDKSPPAKKPSPTMFIPLPGMSGPPPKRLSVESMEDDTTPAREPKRDSKPPGGFRLPGMGARVLPTPPSRGVDKSANLETRPAVFEKPQLRSVTKPDDMKSNEPDKKLFDTSSLRSVPKPEDDDKDTDTRLFTKPPLRSAPQTTKESDSNDTEETSSSRFDVPGLRETPKQPTDDKDKSNEERHVFEVPALRSTPRKLPIVQKEEEEKSSQFDKPVLKSTNIGDTDASSKIDTKSSGVYEKPNLRSAQKELNRMDDQKPSHTFEKPILRRSPSKEAKDTSSVEATSHVFDKPALRTSPVKTVKDDDRIMGVFDKPTLRRTPSKENIMAEEGVQKEKGTFDKPSLRKAEITRQSPENDGKSDSGSHFSELKLRRTNATPDEPKEVGREKPSWLQAAKEKRTKALDVIQAKENQNQSASRSVPAWLEQSPLKKKNPDAQPLKENNLNGTDSKSDVILKSSERKTRASVSEESPRAVSADREAKPNFRKGSLPVAPRENNNYTPSWMKSRSPSSSGLSPLTPSKSMPALNDSDDIPQWKKELAMRRKAKKETGQDTAAQRETPSVPEWTQQSALRKLRQTTSPPKETSSTEPEWKRAAEEKKARLRKAGLVGQSDTS